MGRQSVNCAQIFGAATDYAQIEERADVLRNDCEWLLWLTNGTHIRRERIGRSRRPWICRRLLPQFLKFCLMFPAATEHFTRWQLLNTPKCFHVICRKCRDVNRTSLGTPVAVVVRRCVQKSAPLSLCTRLSFTEHSHQTRGSGNSLRPFCPSSRPGILPFTNRAPLV